MAKEAVRLNDAVVRSLPTPPTGNKVHYFAGATLQGAPVPRGFGVRVTAGGAKSFIMNFRVQRREHRYTIGTYPDWPVLRAVREARTVRQRIDRGENPLADRAPTPAARTVADILDDFIARHVSKLRSARMIESALRRLVLPHIGKVAIDDLRRSHVAAMLDRIEDTAGPGAADRARAYLRKGMAWHAERDDAFNLTAVFVRVRPRLDPKLSARTRVLSDDEIHALWPALGGTFGALVKTLLLTGQRRDEVAHMTRGELGTDGVWAIPAERYKTGRPNFVPLSPAVRAIIEAQPKLNTCDYVFPSRTGRTPLSGFGKAKAKLDRAVPLSNWTLHDLRRTAKTLMVREGVRPDISERVLGHAIAGVEATYDRHDYLAEKRDALDRLAARILAVVQ